ncbi:hypothetical protein JL108_05510 [Aeromicrobium sp. YIM 150415]|uniref:hypothetical protein n=1 Tax=Aeromicrobium sp. YIM 150415 TaxID=2803912 RepID=UPI0019632BA4|nr:hypothetical protein [Aeromicrobium sp. YIM 150415]MBM9462899.1 hypothetical protein [Aeromicrobium sp. YIM 150415]
MSQAALIDDLRAKMRELEGRPQVSSMRVHPVLEGLLEVQPGQVYTVGAASLAMLLMAGPSVQGQWSAVIGATDFGMQAAQAFGVALERTVLVPDPGADWLSVTAALIDVVPVVVVAGRAMASRDAQRITARLHEHQGIVIAWDTAWPRARAHLRLTDVQWEGTDRGAGHLRARRATIEVQHPGRPSRRRELWLPDDHGQVRVADEPPLLRRVG